MTPRESIGPLGATQQGQERAPEAAREPTPGRELRAGPAPALRAELEPALERVELGQALAERAALAVQALAVDGKSRLRGGDFDSKTLLGAAAVGSRPKQGNHLDARS